MTRSSFIRTCFLAVTLVSTTALGACTTDHDLPSLSETTSGTTLSPEESAKTYYDCMRDEGIDAELTSNDHGELSVEFAGDHLIMERSETGDAQIRLSNAHPLSDQAREEFLTAGSGKPALIIDGIDHSDAYVQCLATSGYNPWAKTVADWPDQAEIALQVQGNNTWAACVRENGWPGIEDSVMPTTIDAETQPYVFLPSTMTEDQLRQLLEACPNFNLDMQKQLDDWRQFNPSNSYPDGYLPDPSITFGLPGTGSTASPSVTPEDQDHLDRLYEILHEQSNAYEQEQKEKAQEEAENS